MKTGIKVLILLIIAISLFSCGSDSVRTDRDNAAEALRGKSERAGRPGKTGSAAPQFAITAVPLKEGRVCITFGIDEGIKVRTVTVLRSTTSFAEDLIDETAIPVVRSVVAQPAICYYDESAAHHTKYYYKAVLLTKMGKIIESSVVSVETANVKLHLVRHPAIFIDKSSFTLEVQDGGKCVKRYPVALGRNPVKRKLNQDNSSTPEGVYEIVNIQPEATYYRAYDINYPNETDQRRYRYFCSRGLLPLQGGSVPSIGGEIQIHGRGISWNWTFGCIALRNEDMDELFSSGEIGVGTPVYIAGKEISKADMEQEIRGILPNENEALCMVLTERGFLKKGEEEDSEYDLTCALGDFQMASGLPVTCLFDLRTRAKLFGKHR